MPGSQEQRLSLYRGDGDGNELAVTGIQEAAAGARLLPKNITREPHPDQVSLGDGGRGGQGAATGPVGLDLPAIEADADVLGVPGEDQGAPGVASEGDQTAQFAGGAAVAQQ